MGTFNEIPFEMTEIKRSVARGMSMKVVLLCSHESKKDQVEFDLSDVQMDIAIKSLFKKNEKRDIVLYSDEELFQSKDMYSSVNDNRLHSVNEAGMLLAMWKICFGTLDIDGITPDDLSLVLTDLQMGVLVARLGLNVEMKYYVSDETLYMIYGSDWKPEFEAQPDKRKPEKKVLYTKENMLDGVMVPKKIKKMLDKALIGQDGVKEKLATAVYQQEIAVRYNTVHKTDEGFIPLQRKNILMYGPSGSGKTAMIIQLAAILDRPVVVYDATALTPAGYHGKSVDSILYELVEKADGDVDKAANGIVYLDEWDKAFAGATTNMEVSTFKGEASSYELLRMMDGCDVLVERCNETFTINTENILFIVGGAFPNLDQIVKARFAGKKDTARSAIGFMSGKVKPKIAENDDIPDATLDDLKAYGIPTELLGRIATICRFKPLDRQDLVNILLHSEKSPLREYMTMFEIHNVTLQFTKKTVEAIADQALTKNLGARGLVSELGKVLFPMLYKLAGNQKKLILQLKPECFTQGVTPVIVKQLKSMYR